MRHDPIRKRDRNLSGCRSQRNFPGLLRILRIRRLQLSHWTEIQHFLGRSSALGPIMGFLIVVIVTNYFFLKIVLNRRYRTCNLNIV